MHRSPPAIVAVAVVLLVLLPALDVLSVGPAVGLYARGIISEETLGAIYLPLEYAAELLPIGDVLDWYVELWVPD